MASDVKGKIPELIAQTRRSYAGRRLTIGERFTPRTERDARVLVKLGLAKLAAADRPEVSPGRPHPEQPIAEPRPNRPSRPRPEQPIAEPRPPVTPAPLPAEPAPPEIPPEPAAPVSTTTVRGRKPS